jgi:hypothetical protein
MKKFERLLYRILSISMLTYCYSSGASILGIVPFTNAITWYAETEIHTRLLKNLQFEQLPGGIVPQLVDSAQCSSCITLVYGRLEYIDSVPSLRFFIADREKLEKEQKVFPLASNSLDDVIDLCVLKIRTHLERNHSVKIRISSRPLDCEMYLNGVKVGKTPAELTLEKGMYKLALEHEFCKPYHDSISVNSGVNFDIDATLTFEGLVSKPFWYSSALLTVSTIAVWVLESRYHREYRQLGKGVSDNMFNDLFNRYRTAYYCRLGILNGAILSWTITGYVSFKNTRLKRALFSQPENH